MTAQGFDRPLCGEIDELVSALLRDDIDDESLRRLEALVCENTAARRLYVAYMQTTQTLRLWACAKYGDHAPSAPETTPAPPALGAVVSNIWQWARDGLSNPTNLSFLIAGFVMASVLAVLAFTCKPHFTALHKAEPTDRSPSPVATVLRTVGCVWRHPADTCMRGDRLAPQQTLALQSGILEIRFDSGALLVLQGPVAFTVDGENGGTLKDGRIAARVPGEAVGFSVESPVVQVVDLGTEFGMISDEKGGTEVHVFAGRVEARVLCEGQPSGEARVLRANEAASFSPDGGAVKPMVADAGQFVRDAALCRYAQATLDTPRLVGYWRIDGARGVVVGNLAGDRRFDGRIAGRPVVEAGPCGEKFPGFEPENRAVKNDGVSQNGVAVEYFPKFKIWTVDAWARPLDVLGNPESGQTIVSCNKAEWTNDLLLGLHPSSAPTPKGHWTVACNPVKHGDTVPAAYDRKQAVAGRWYYVAVTYDGAVMTLYVDGQPVDKLSQTALMVGGNGSPLWIAGHSPTGGAHRGFIGLVDEVALYDRALSADEVAAKYAAAVSPPAAHEQ